MRLEIDRSSPLPLQEQLKEQIRLLIDSGELRPEAGLPTIREMAERLEVNGNTVAAAYRALEQEGYVTQRKRAGTAVAAKPPRSLERSLAARLAAEASQRARAAGVDPADLMRAVAVYGLLEAVAPRLRVAALASTPLAAAALAERTAAALGEQIDCVGVTPEQYKSVDYHLTVVDPQLTARLPWGEPTRRGPALPAHLSYGPEFPAGAD